MSKRPFLAALVVTALVGSPASAQILGGGLGGGGGGPLGGGGLGGVVGQVGKSVDQTVGGLTGPINSALDPFNVGPPTLDRVTQAFDVNTATPGRILDLRRERLNALIRANRKTLDRDSDGQPVRKGELIVTDPDPASLALAVRSGFRLTADQHIAELGLRMVTLATPRGMNVRDALKQLRKLAPALAADYNHVFEPAGGALLPAAAASLAVAPSVRSGTRIAMIDGGVASHPSLARAGIEQRGFAGAAQPTGHGTAVGSLLVGSQGPFNGAARGAQLFVGDVYGGNPAAGTATTIVRALAWAASKSPTVINISLVGPANQTMARAIATLRARGIAVVAPVGNDGPAAPPQFPASYPGVVAVTGVDAGDRALREAGRALHLDFAAPGADLVAAVPGQGFVVVRGTSFAAPLVSARIAATGSSAQLAREAVPGKGRVGQGIVCKLCRTSPKAVGIK